MTLFYVVNYLISFGLVTLIFALIFKVLPDAEVTWRGVWIGAAITALLFVIGEFAMSIYFTNANPGSAFGAAGPLVILLLWISYSCLILFFGAEFTQVYARRYGHNIVPSEHAERTAEFKIRNNEIDCDLPDEEKKKVGKS